MIFYSRRILNLLPHSMKKEQLIEELSSDQMKGLTS